jgi:hypothetical protein
MFCLGLTYIEDKQVQETMKHGKRCWEDSGNTPGTPKGHQECRKMLRKETGMLWDVGEWSVDVRGHWENNKKRQANAENAKKMVVQDNKKEVDNLFSLLLLV